MSTRWLLVLVLSAAVAARAEPLLERQIAAFRLPNGMAVIVVVQPELELAAVHLQIGGGSSADPPEQSGMAHLLEHASLTGTLALGSLDPPGETVALAEVDDVHAALDAATHEGGDSGEIARLRARAEEAERHAAAFREPGEIYGAAMERRGVIGMNAVTTSEWTQYFCRLPASEIAGWMEREADRIANPLFRDFYRERRIVLREIGTAGSLSVLARLLPMVGDRHPAGEAASVERIGRREALRRFRAQYIPSNMAIVVVGNVDPLEIRRRAEHTFGTLSANRPPISQTPGISEPVDRIAVVDGWQTAVSIRPAGAWPSRRGAAFDALASLLVSPALSPRPARALSVRVRRVPVGSGALEVVEAIYPPAVTAVDIRSDLQLLAARLAGDKAALRGAILASRRELHAAITDPSSFAGMIATAQLREGDWRRVADRVRETDSLRESDVVAVARALFAGDAFEESGLRAAAPAVSTRVNRTGAVRDIRLQNGLVVVLGQTTRRSDPAGALLVIPAGPMRSAAAVEAFARLHRLGRRLAEEGFSADVSSGRELTFVRFAAPPASAEVLLGAISDFLSLTTDDGAWQEAAAETEERLARDVWMNGNAALETALWRDPETPSDVAGKPAALPSARVLAIWSGEPTQRLEHLVRRTLSGLTLAGTRLTPTSPMLMSRGPIVCVAMTAADPPVVFVGMPLVTADSKAFFAAQLAAQILGGGYASRLHRRLRFAADPIYTVEASCIPKGQGALTLRVACQTGNIAGVHDAILEEISRLRDEGPDELELETARAILLSRLRLGADSMRSEIENRAVALATGVAGHDRVARATLLGFDAERFRTELSGLLGRVSPVVVIVSARRQPLCAGGISRTEAVP